MLDTKIVYSNWHNFDFVKRDCKKLVVTIGESWTWGDSLGQTRHTIYDDKEFRLAHVYGQLLANKLEADFLNIAEPGQSNLWIANHLKLFVDNIDQFSYDEITVILTLTEVGREFEGDLDKHRDYMSDLKNIVDLNEFLSALSSYITNEILSVDQTKIKLLVATNFVDSNYSTQLNVLPKSWVDVIATELETSVPKPCHVVNSWVFDRFHQLLAFTPLYKKEKFLNNMLAHMEVANTVIDFLLASKFNYKKASKHPTPEGHQLWADYLYTELKEQHE
jgi:hypothetical protein